MDIFEQHPDWFYDMGNSGAWSYNKGYDLKKLRMANFAYFIRDGYAFIVKSRFLSTANFKVTLKELEFWKLNSVKRLFCKNPICLVKEEEDGTCD